MPDVIEYYRGGDALELHLDLQPDSAKKPSYLQTESHLDRYVIWICPKGGGFHGDRPYIGQGAPEFIPNYQAANLDVSVRQHAGYYVIEARIPFFPVLRGFHPLKTKQHNRIGFNFVIHRSNNQPIYWVSQIAWGGVRLSERFGTVDFGVTGTLNCFFYWTRLSSSDMIGGTIYCTYRAC